MRRFTQVALIVFAILGFSPNVHAVPTFTWEGPWSVTLFPFPDCFKCDRGFGDRTADTAVAKSQSSSGVSGSSQAGVNFSREFLLSDAPQGWTASVNGTLIGSLNAFPGLSGATVSAMASITPSISINFSEEIFGGDLRFPVQRPVIESESQPGMLSDGLYTVSGSLVTAAGGMAPSGAASDFLSNTSWGFQVSVTATPVPELSAILLLGTGLVGFVWAYRRQDRHRNLSEFS
jgi:hypothetical protein